jgi:hypothetical protein
MVVKEIRWEDLYWIHLAQDKDRWRPRLNMAINPFVLSRILRLEMFRKHWHMQYISLSNPKML